MLKLGAAAIGGYVLGRFKKGRAAISFAMWMAGAKDPKAMLRDGLLSAAQTPEAQQLLSQLRGPALEAGRRVASATFENQIGALTAALEQRTKALTSGDDGEAGDPDARRRKGRKKDRARAEERPSDDEDQFDEYEEEPEEDEETDSDEYEEEPEEDETEDDEDEEEAAQAAEPAPERRRRAQPARKKAAPAAKKSSQPAKQATPPSDAEPPNRRAKRSAPAGRAPRRNRTEGARA
jgi:hypothetical protein